MKILIFALFAITALSSIAEEAVKPPKPPPEEASLPPKASDSDEPKQPSKKEVARARATELKAYIAKRRELPIEGRVYNTVLKRFLPMEVSVSADSDGDVLIRAHDISNTTAFISTTDSISAAALLWKAVDWAETSREKAIETTKTMGAFGSRVRTHRQGIALQFFSASEGRQTDVILKIAGCKNMFDNAEIYLDIDAVKLLAERLNDVDDLVKDAKRNKSKADIYLK